MLYLLALSVLLNAILAVVVWYMAAESKEDKQYIQHLLEEKMYDMKRPTEDEDIFKTGI